MDTTLKVSKLMMAVSLLPLTAFAGDWKFTPSVGVDTIYSDNINLVNSLDTESGVVNQSFLRLQNEYVAKQATLSFDFKGLYATYSHDSSLNDSFVEFQGDGKMSLWEHGPAVFASMTVDNQVLNARQNAFASYISANTTQVTTGNLGIEFNRQTNVFNLSTQILHSETQSKDGIGERNGEVFSLSLSNGRNPKSLIWDISGSYNKFTQNQRDAEFYILQSIIGYRSPYKINPLIRYSKEENKGSIARPRSFASDFAGVGISWLPSPKLTINVSYNSSLSGVDKGDKFVSSLIDWEPSRRTSLSMGVDRRFYGDSYSFDFKHKNRRFTNSINYSEQIQAFTRSSFERVIDGQFWCPTSALTDDSELFDPANCQLGDSTVVDFDNFNLVTLSHFNLLEDDQYILNKGLNWQSDLQLARTDFSLRLFHNEINFLSNDRQDLREGFTLSSSRKLSPKSKLSISYTFNKNEFDVTNAESNQIDYYRRTTLSLRRDFSRTLDIDFAVHYLDRQSSIAEQTYDEGQLSLKLNKAF